MNRNIWKPRGFTTKDPIQYPCSKCSHGHLRKDKSQNLITESGKEMEKYNYPYGIQHMYSGIWKCSNSECAQVYAVSGELLKNTEDPIIQPDGHCTMASVTIVNPKHFHPNLRLFEIPKELSQTTINHIDLSFAAYFSDLTSSANRLRSAAESLLNDIKAPSKRKTKKGDFQKFKRLHDRIVHLKKTRLRIAELLLAIKIIGNEGSHLGELNVDDVLDGYEIFEEVLEIIYFKHGDSVLAKAKAINNTNKPRSKK